MTTAKERMEHGKELYDIVVEDNEKLEEMLEFMKEVFPRILPLSKYYFSQWLEDYTDLLEENFNNEIMNEDSVYDEITRQYQLMKEILLVSAEYINKDMI